ncbi:MAG: TrkA family potassium uptake protein [Bacilli bacterium]|nr:TrkA family potassium uptake protein [Bacilli bacterium]
MATKKGTIGIVGLGKFGMQLAEELVENGRKIVCIDKDEKKVKKALELTDYAFVSEDLSKETFEETGFKQCETIVICIGEHLDTAILATLNALSLGVKKVVAMSVTDETGQILEKLGAEVVYPFKDSADHLAKKILTHNILDFISLNDEIEIAEIKVPKSFVGKSIIESNIRQNFGINIIALEVGDKINTKVDPKYIFNEGDAVVVIGDSKSVRKFEQKK